MGTVFNVIFSASFGYAVLRVTTPILFAALAAIISDRAGVINISLEGTMLISALIGVLVSAFTQSASLGLFAAVIAGILVAFILAYCSLNLKVDIILTGIAINMFASGGTVFLLYLITKDKGMSGSLKSMVLPNLNIPFLKDIPILGSILSGHNILTYLAFLSVLVVYIFLYKTTLGLRIRATGEYPSAIESIGISPKRVQYIALMISGMLSGFGGAFMSMGYVSWFSRDMVAGRGFIALAAEAMGRGNPLGTLVASLVFGGADALSNSLQTLQMPAEFVMMIPYLTTIIGITIYSIQKASKNK